MLTLLYIFAALFISLISALSVLLIKDIRSRDRPPTVKEVDE